MKSDSMGRVRGEGCNVGGPEQLFNTHSQNYSTEHQCFLDPIKKIFLYNYNSPYDHASIFNMLPLRLSNSKLIEKQLHYFVCILRLKLYQWFHATDFQIYLAPARAFSIKLPNIQMSGALEIF